MKFFNPLILTGLAFALAGPALADKPAYCAAYARDFADARTKDRPLWQHKYDIALQACLGPSAQPVVKLSKSKKTETPIAAAEASPKLVKPIKAEKEMKPDAPPKLFVGSDDWNTYCANKYTSFNPKTGTYMSKTGVERKCIISAN